MLSLTVCLYSFRECPCSPYGGLANVKRCCGSMRCFPVIILYVSIKSPWWVTVVCTVIGRQQFADCHQTLIESYILTNVSRKTSTIL